MEQDKWLPVAGLDGVDAPTADNLDVAALR
jgi:hypothetical protein